MYKLASVLLVIFMVAGCVSENKRLLASEWQTLDYGDYYLKQNPPNGQSALKLYERASLAGNKWAEFKAAELLYTGKYGVSKNKTKAIEYYKSASDKGVSWATYNLAMAYKNGDGVIEDKVESVRLAKIARSQSKGVNGYFDMLLYDLLKDSDPAEANKYLVEAADSGFQKARDTMNEKKGPRERQTN